MEQLIHDILAAPPLAADAGDIIGWSREDRPVRACRLGNGPVRVSLIAGNHADEPVGPLLLRHLASWLAALPPAHPLLTRCSWWIVPHTNPDGEARNPWFDPRADAIDPVAYLTRVVREKPGDDMEFGFPRDEDDAGARPENRAIAAWWQAAGGPFTLHVSLHGMGFAAGPWFLIDAAWKDRCSRLKERCRAVTARLGYQLHDVERHGDKGFHRLEPGFCTRPDSLAMAAYFLERDDPETAGRFRPSSMEFMRQLGGDCLTLVSEMPLLITPGVGVDLGPPDPAAVAWRQRVTDWAGALIQSPDQAAPVRRQMAEAGLLPMPLHHQMALQWAFITAGLEETHAA